MLPEVRPHVSTALADQLEHQLDLAPHLEVGRLDVKGIAGIAVVAAAHSDGYAATGHLLGLLAALPAPTKAEERFWSDLWRSSGTAYLLAEVAPGSASTDQGRAAMAARPWSCALPAGEQALRPVGGKARTGGAHRTQ